VTDHERNRARDRICEALRVTGPPSLPGDHWEEDENGVMVLRRANGAVVMWMTKGDYDAIARSG
jgi:hypothetical protein